MTIHGFAEVFAGVAVLLYCGQILFDFLHDHKHK